MDGMGWDAGKGDGVGWGGIWLICVGDWSPMARANRMDGGGCRSIPSHSHPPHHTHTHEQIGTAALGARFACGLDFKTPSNRDIWWRSLKYVGLAC